MKIREILEWLDMNEVSYYSGGDENAEINSFSSLSNYKPGSVTWIKKQDNYDKAGRPVNISLAVIQSDCNVDFDNYISCENSKEVFFAILHHFWGKKMKNGFVGEGTVTVGVVDISPEAYIGYNCSLVGNIKIGARTVIENNVSITGDVIIGNDCHIQSGVVIGIDGFGYSRDSVSGRKAMIEHFGGVRIGNDCFIGSHTNIARGTIDDTVIGNGVKIAPSTHIGHNNIIEDDATVICSNLFGSVHTGAEAYIVSSTIENQRNVGANTVIGMGSVVDSDIPDNVIAYGTPAKVRRENNSGL